ncbi:putative ester cyclase [Hasllibacter halocynthiae]|uniref:Putative ester cyclase n=1 Tax=Hasllibacter halocynthiae TaxID=595589 RepID=A0A2T0X6W1_9RHOB|nr:ester cyclase [Hasllibacter halocynthiae]PRY94663.1 putative ester cyclase [Hasllibacter halocynthiae]
MGLDGFRRALYAGDHNAAREDLLATCAPDARMHLFTPAGDREGPKAAWEAIWAPLLAAMPDLERRDHIFVRGGAPSGEWVGSSGQYCGTFRHPFMDIPATGQVAHLRFAEFFRIDGGHVVEAHVLWDLPELMMQAGVWPMGPSLGREMNVPGPVTQDGLGPHDAARTAASEALVLSMLDGIQKHEAEGPDAMGLAEHWHPHFLWYGPSGIGTARGVEGFRRWHQIPFLEAMPDRVGGNGRGALFAEGDYVAYTGWPGMEMTVTGAGWLGIAPAGQRITMRSLDFWRCEDGSIRENWVLIDLIHVWNQLGVDVLARMRQLASARGIVVGGEPVFPYSEKTHVSR